MIGDFRSVEQKVCSKCKTLPPREGQRYCGPCHNAYQRANRPKYKDLTPIQKLKIIARSKAKMALRRGELKPQHCLKCGHADTQMHHEDYGRPYNVTWLCKDCHVELHTGHKVSPYRRALNRIRR